MSLDTLPTLPNQDNSQYNSPGRRPSVDELIRIFNPVVLLPVPGRRKACYQEGWQNFSAAQMLDANYIASLKKHSNTAVATGPQSNHLVGIDLDRDDAVQPFLNANPALAYTFRVRGGRGEKLIVRMSGDYPEGKLGIFTTDGEKCGDWLSCGSLAVVSGIHESGQRYWITSANTPVTTTFRAIQWPGMQVPDPLVFRGHCTQKAESRNHDVSPPMYATVESVLVGTRLTGQRQTNERQFETVRWLKRLALDRGSPLSQEELDDAYERWYELNRPHLRHSKAVYKAEFMSRYFAAEYPAGSREILVSAWARVKTRPLPPEVQAFPIDLPEIKLMAAFCRELQVMRGDKPFPLSCGVMADLLNHNSRSTVSGWFGTLQHYGYIRCVSRGTRGIPGEGTPLRASEYLYLKLT